MNFIYALASDPMSASDYAKVLPTVAWIGVMVLLLYFMIIRPQRKRDKAEKTMRSSLKVGDEICTIGGIVGKIVSMKDDGTMVIESSADRTHLKMYTWAIRNKENEAADGGKTAAEKELEQEKKESKEKKD